MVSTQVNILASEEATDHGSVSYLAGIGVSFGDLDLQASALGIPTLEFSVDPGHSQDLVFTFDSLLSAELLGDYQIVVQRWDEAADQWTSVDGLSEGASILDIGVLDGDSYGVEQRLASGDYRAFVTFEGIGVSILNTLAIDGTDYDHTQIVGYETAPIDGNVMDNDPVTTPDTVVQSVNGETVAGVGTEIVGTYGTLSIDPDGNFTYTPFGTDGAGIGQVDTFDYTLIDTVTLATTTSTLFVQIGSDGVAMTWNPDDPGAPASIDFSASDDTTTSEVVWANVTDSEYFNDSDNLLGILGTTVTSTSDTFVIDANMDALGSISVAALGLGNTNVTLALQIDTGGGNWVNVATDTHSGIIVSLGEIASLDLSTLTLDPGTYRVETTMQTPLLGGTVTTINTSTDVDVAYLDQFEIDSINGHEGNLLTNDDPGSEFTQLQIFDGTDYVTVTSSGPVTVAGAHGSLTVDADGNYVYTPDHSTASEVDTFSYQLVHPTGETDQGALTVTVDASGAGVDVEPLDIFSMMAEDLGTADGDGGSDIDLILEENDGDVDLDALGIPQNEDTPIIPDLGSDGDDLQHYADPVTLDDDLENHV